MKFVHIISLFLSLLLLLSSCVDDGLIEEEVMDALPKVKVITDKYEVGLFEMSLLEISSDRYPKNSLKNSFMFSEIMDSLIWNIPGEFKDKSHANYFLANKGQVFIRPAKYKFEITGYKGGNIISKDSLEINVVDKYDFLGVNWKALKDSSFATYDNTILDIRFRLKTFRLSTGPVATLHYQTSSDYKIENRTNFAARSKKILTDYITELYGIPKYDENSVANRWLPPFKTMFESDFKYQLASDEVPLTIWETKTSRIALIEKKYLEKEENRYYWIIAEPFERSLNYQK